MSDKEAAAWCNVYWNFFKGKTECDKGYWVMAYVRHATDVCRASLDTPRVYPIA